MSGSLQRRKKSKRKWKRLWFLLKDKVLYTFTAREVRGHRVSHASPKTRAHPMTEPCPLNLCLTLPFPLFNLSSRAEHRQVTNEGILCALSFCFFWLLECCTAFEMCYA